MKKLIAVMNAVTIVLLCIPSLNRVDFSLQIAVGLGGGTMVGLVSLRDPARIPFYSSLNVSNRKMWSIYSGILVVLAVWCMWAFQHRFGFISTGRENDLIPRLVAYLTGLILMVAKPSPAVGAK